MAKSRRPKLTPDEQISEMERLSPRATAWLLGLGSERALNENIALSRVRNANGTYSGRKAVEYAATVRRRRTDRPGDKDRMARDAAAASGAPDSDSPLDAKRRLEAEKIELEILRLQKQLVPVQMTTQFFGEMASRLRVFGETLQRDFGPDALLLLNELLSGMEAHVERWLESTQVVESV